MRIRLNDRNRPLGCILSVFLLFMISPLGGYIDDTEIYQRKSVGPNVVILFDTSGSIQTIPTVLPRYHKAISTTDQVSFGDAHFTTYTPAQEGIDDPCYLEEGTGRLYALYYQTGEAVLNYDSFNDACGEILGRSDRSMVIGGSIPSGLVMAIIQGKLEGYIGIRGGILQPEIGSKTSITRIYWREIL